MLTHAVVSIRYNYNTFHHGATPNCLCSFVEPRLGFCFCSGPECSPQADQVRIKQKALPHSIALSSKGTTLASLERVIREYFARVSDPNIVWLIYPIDRLGTLGSFAVQLCRDPALTLFCFDLFSFILSVSAFKIDPQLYDDAVSDWEKQFPAFSKWGWGPSVQAEKWNGRHAMFGWFFICATAYCKGHGLIPDPEMLLDLKQWGTLATISGKDTISNERAIILVANAHFFALSLAATICPLPFGDSLFVDPNHPNYEAMAERNKNGFGYLPALKFGLTEEAEIINGRLAMLGLVMLIGATATSGQNMLDIVNEWVGGAYF